MPRSALATGLLLFTICAGVLTPPARSEKSAGQRVQKHQMKQQIADLERQWRAATLTVDLPAMDRLLSEDFVGISLGGQVNTKSMQLDRVRNRTIVITRMDLSELRIKLVGAIAIVTSLAQVEGVSDGAQLNGLFRYIRVYQRLPSGLWKITNFEATRVRSPNESAIAHSAAP